MPPARAWIALAALSLAAARVEAQSPVQHQDQFWPEADYYQKLTDRTRLFVLASYSFGGDAGQQDQQYGINYDVNVKRPTFFRDTLGAEALDDDRRQWLQLRFGYRYFETIESPEVTVQNRLLAELTIRGGVMGLLTADRNGFDWRWTNGVWSTRYRNRLDFQRPLTAGHYTFTPYSNVEVYYVLGRSGFNAVKWEFGAELPVAAHFTAIPYFGIQNTWGSSPVYTDAFGLTVVASF